MTEDYLHTDFHMHSHFSPDAQNHMLEMCERAVDLGYTAVAFTDHAEWHPNWPFRLDFDDYFQQIAVARQQYERQGLRILSGVEYGNPHQFPDEIEQLREKYSFDVQIGSLHWLYGQNIHNKACFKFKHPDLVYNHYFSELLKIVDVSEIDILAHFDRIFWRGYKEGFFIDKLQVGSVARELFTAVVEKNIALELNTRLLSDTLQWHDLLLMFLSWYKEVGGNQVVLNADAHNTDQIGVNRQLAISLLAQVDLKPAPHFHPQTIKNLASDSNTIP